MGFGFGLASVATPCYLSEVVTPAPGPSVLWVLWVWCKQWGLKQLFSWILVVFFCWLESLKVSGRFFGRMCWVNPRRSEAPLRPSRHRKGCVWICDWGSLDSIASPEVAWTMMGLFWPGDVRAGHSHRDAFVIASEPLLAGHDLLNSQGDLVATNPRNNCWMDSTPSQQGEFEIPGPQWWWWATCWLGMLAMAGRFLRQTSGWASIEGFFASFSMGCFTFIRFHLCSTSMKESLELFYIYIYKDAVYDVYARLWSGTHESSAYYSSLKQNVCCLSRTIELCWIGAHGAPFGDFMVVLMSIAACGGRVWGIFTFRPVWCLVPSLCRWCFCHLLCLSPQGMGLWRAVEWFGNTTRLLGNSRMSFSRNCFCGTGMSFLGSPVHEDSFGKILCWMEFEFKQSVSKHSVWKCFSGNPLDRVTSPMRSQRRTERSCQWSRYYTYDQSPDKERDLHLQM